MEFKLPEHIENLRLKTRDFVNQKIIPLESDILSYDEISDSKGIIFWLTKSLVFNLRDSIFSGSVKSINCSYCQRPVLSPPSTPIVAPVI